MVQRFMLLQSRRSFIQQECDKFMPMICLSFWVLVAREMIRLEGSISKVFQIGLCCFRNLFWRSRGRYKESGIFPENGKLL